MSVSFSSLSLFHSQSLSSPFCFCLSVSVSPCWAVSFGLPPPCPLSSLSHNRKRSAKDCDYPPSRLPTLPPPQVFSLAPYSRQIKCAQLLPAEAGLNCTPVAMAIPDDLRGWNDALGSPCWGLGLHSLAGPGADLAGTLEAAGQALPQHTSQSPVPFPSSTPNSTTPHSRDSLGSDAITHKLPGRDKAFLCHQPRPRFRGEKEGFQVRALCSRPHPLTCGPAAATPTMGVGGSSTQSSPFMAVSI